MSVRRSVSDTSDLNDTRSLAVLAVPAGSTVLCVSRNDFEIDQMLKARGCRVVSSGLEPVGSADAETFDAVLMLDVLAYVDDAAAAIARARKALKPGGRLIASFANVAHGAVRLSLVHGTFPYSDGGLLDRARVRFFDHHTSEALLLDGGFRIDERLRVTRELDETEINTRLTISPDLVASIRSDPEATTYEFVFVASQAAGLAETAPEASLAERLQKRVEQLVAENCALSERLRRLCAEIDAREASARDADERASQLQHSVVALEAELSRRMEELRVRHHERRQLQTDIVDREAFIAQFRTKVAADRAWREALETELRDVQAAREALETELRDARARQETLETELRDAHAGRETLETELRDARARRETLETELRDARARRETLQTELRDAHAGRETLETELRDARAGRETLETELCDARAGRETLQTELRDARAERETLQTELRDARAEVERYSAIAARPVDKTRENRLQAKLAATTTELAHTREKLEAFRTYANSKGFRLVDSIAVRLRRYPSAYHTARALVRSMVK